MSERTVEEYLESIGALGERESPVSTSSIAQVLEVSPASVSEMLHRLSKKGLVEYTPYGGATLAEKGRRHFLRLTRRHRFVGSIPQQVSRDRLGRCLPACL